MWVNILYRLLNNLTFCASQGTSNIIAYHMYPLLITCTHYLSHVPITYHMYPLLITCTHYSFLSLHSFLQKKIILTTLQLYKSDEAQ